MGILTFLLKLVLLVFVLGIIILVHEFGHFIWAKAFKVHIYEFSIGMGPLLFTHKGKKDYIDYNVRAIPIGGYVAMAGEVYADDDQIPKEKLMCNKPWWQRLIILVAGVMNNFIMAIILLMLYAAIWGPDPVKPVLNTIAPESAAEEAGLVTGDEILKINGYKVASWDKAQIILNYKNKNEYYEMTIKHQDGTKEDIIITPKEIVDETTGEKSLKFGFSVAPNNEKSFLGIIKYGFVRFATIIDSMYWTVAGLITGNISLNALSGPVGIFEVVGESLSYTFSDAIRYIIYLIALLSVNVGFINILPFPAFDGGHVFFILVEKIKGSPVNQKFESICHTIGFALIFLLMIIVTINDIIRLF